MAWQRIGDTAADDPRLLAVQTLPDADERTLNEVRGFIMTLSGESAKYTTDYVLNMGQVIKAAGGFARAEVLTGMCERVGLLERVEVNGLPGVKLVEDPDFIHLRKKDELEWERQRKRDNSDPNLRWPVILRDGDRCRWCRREVHWTGKVSNRKATLDHLEPGRPATVGTLVVACITCNSARQDDEDGSWGASHPLLPPPTRPQYGRWSRNQLAEHGLLHAPADTAAAGSESKVDTSGPDQAVQVLRVLGTPPVPQQPAAGRPKGLQGVHPGTADHGAPAGPSSQPVPPVSASVGRSPVGVNPGADGGAGAAPRRRPRRGSSDRAFGAPASRPCRPAGSPSVGPESCSSPPRVLDEFRTQSGLSPDSRGTESVLPGTGRDWAGEGPGGDGSAPGRSREGPGTGSGRDGTGMGGAGLGSSSRRRKRR